MERLEISLENLKGESSSQKIFGFRSHSNLLIVSDEPSVMAPAPFRCQQPILMVLLNGIDDHIDTLNIDVLSVVPVIILSLILILQFRPSEHHFDHHFEHHSELCSNHSAQFEKAF